ncbi:MAG: hypothetical protein JST80_03165 [Bdellovibrionales bacterium]|nr:hypothetical protein [Bdellovibrionales bacterium]
MKNLTLSTTISVLTLTISSIGINSWADENEQIHANQAVTELRELKATLVNTNEPDQAHVLELAQKVFPAQFKGKDYDQSREYALKKWPATITFNYEKVPIISYGKITATSEYKKFANKNPDQVSDEALYTAEQLADAKQTIAASKQRSAELSQKIARTVEKADRVPAESK